MTRLALTLTLALLACALAAGPASAADRCRPRSGEDVLARSAEAVVLQKLVRQSQHFPLQTITGCSRRSGRRRTLDTIQRRTEEDQTTLVGLKLSGTRVAYAMVRVLGESRLTLMADDAIHGGRRHDLGIDGWPFGNPEHIGVQTAVDWTVDAQGEVAWTTTERQFGSRVPAPQALGVWRAGLGRRQVDSRAYLTGVTLRDGVLRWKRNGVTRRVDLASVPATRCGALKATSGTLEVDMARDRTGVITAACLRATGVTVPLEVQLPELLDVNGPYLVFEWAHVGSYTAIVDLVHGTSESISGASADTVIDEHGSLAWTSDGLWVRDAGGTRKVADSVMDPDANSGVLLRDGSTVTWPSRGVTVTMNP